MNRAPFVALRAAQRATMKSARNMSGHGSPEEVFQSKEMWFKTTVFATIAIIVPYTAAVVYLEANHHHEEKANYPHMNQMHKGWPWKSPCALFDVHCAHELKAHKSGAAAHH